MGNERELKLLPLQEINRNQLLDTLANNGYKIEGTIKRVNQLDTYYDTQDKSFFNSDRSFRIREVEGKFFVTYKVPTGLEKAYTDRKEFEEEIPAEYINQEGTVSLSDAITILKRKYPNIDIPEDLNLAVRVNNNRSKVNIVTEDGSVVEVAFDDVLAEDENGDFFNMNEEIEFEVLSGNPEELNKIQDIILQNYDMQKNTLSKYSRAIKEILEQKQNMTLEEITICAMLSDIIGTSEFEQLKHKGQIIHDYRIEMPDNLDLNNFKDPQYLMRKISEVKE